MTFSPRSSGEVYKAYIQSAVFYEEICDVDDVEDDDCPDVGRLSGYLITLDRKAPNPGTAFTISKANKRYKANGSLTDDTTAVEMFQSILDNCHGIFRMNAAQIEVIIKKALSDSEIDTIINEHLFTDRGTKRNIIYNEAGKSTIRVWRENTEDVVNGYSVEFPDDSRDYHTSVVTVYDDTAQTRAATKLSEHGDRRKLTESAQLILTSNIDQATRILALAC